MFNLKSGKPLVLVTLIWLTGCQHTAFETERDPSGCLLERVAVEEGVHSFQFDSLSPDGRLLGIGWSKGDDERGTYLLDLISGERTDVPGFNNGATFSPDGTTLLNSIYVDGGKTDIAEYDRRTGKITIIAQHEDWDWLASYSSDGEWIVFNSYRGGNSDVYLYKRSDGSMRQMTESDRYDAHAQLSPDGKTIVFNRQDGPTDYNVYKLDVATGVETQLTDSPREEGYPSWSADGRYIIYSSDAGNEAGKLNIHVMTSDGTHVQQLTAHKDKDGYPFASPDGEYVYFNTDRQPNGVYRIKINDDMSCKQ